MTLSQLSSVVEVVDLVVERVDEQPSGVVLDFVVSVVVSLSSVVVFSVTVTTVVFYHLLSQW